MSSVIDTSKVYGTVGMFRWSRVVFVLALTIKPYVMFASSPSTSAERILSDYRIGVSTVVADLAAEIQKDSTLMGDLLASLLKQRESCLGRDADPVTTFHEHRFLQTNLTTNSTNATLTNSTDSALAKAIAKFAKQVNKQTKTVKNNKKTLTNLTAQVADLRNFTLSNQGWVLNFNGSFAVAIDAVTNVIETAEKKVTTGASALSSLRVIVSSFTADVTSVSTVVTTHTTTLDAAEINVNKLQADVTNLQSSVSTLVPSDTSNTNKLTTLQGKYVTNKGSLDALTSTATQTATSVTNLAASVASNTAKLQCVSPPESAASTDLVFSGCNVQVMNGMTGTETSNGLGNLIVGRNEDGQCDTPDGLCPRDGSHNLVLGKFNMYRSYGGIIAGTKNEISQSYASVTAGQKNKATGTSSSVSGGCDNVASGQSAVVSGGQFNTASAFGAVVNGGRFNRAQHQDSTVVGHDLVSSTSNEGLFS